MRHLQFHTYTRSYEYYYIQVYTRNTRHIGKYSNFWHLLRILFKIQIDQNLSKKNQPPLNRCTLLLTLTNTEDGPGEGEIITILYKRQVLSNESKLSIVSSSCSTVPSLPVR